MLTRTAVAALLAIVLVSPANAVDLRPTMNGNFGHYTLALTWQPGICSTDEGCRPDQPRSPLIGLHGLWASRPKALIQRGVDVHVWWSRGCGYYGVKTAGPVPLAPRLLRRVRALMPHFKDDLLSHEYWKHVACFGFDPNTFFSTELALRDAVTESRFGRYLLHRVGTRVRRDVVTAQFAADFHTNQEASLQLQCAKNAAGEQVLTQVWITIKASQLTAFPRNVSLMDALQNQTTCPQRFLVPAWSSQ